MGIAGEETVADAAISPTETSDPTKTTDMGEIMEFMYFMVVVSSTGRNLGHLRDYDDTKPQTLPLNSSSNNTMLKFLRPQNPPYCTTKKECRFSDQKLSPNLQGDVVVVAYNCYGGGKEEGSNKETRKVRGLEREEKKLIYCLNN